MKTYTVKEIADMLNTNPETVRRWIRNGKLHAEKYSNKTGNVIPEASLNTFVSTKPKYQKMISSYDSKALMGTGVAVAGSIISGIIADINKSDNLEYDDKTVIQLISDEISKSLKRIDNKEKSIYQLELEIKEEKSKVENLTCLLSEVKGKE